jgi:hypothetical protein
MKTDQLISALSADRLAPTRPIDRSILLALLGGSALAAVVFALLLDVRANAVESLGEWRFVMKFVVTLGLALPAISLLLRSARPLSDRMPWWLLLIAPLILGIGVASELMSIPSAAWSQRLMGHNAMYCLALIPLLSIAPLVSVFAALKRGAPERPGVAGAVSGLVCSGIAAALYATHCSDDSPLFVATWYVIAIAVVTLIAGLVGSRWLRW